MNISNNGIDTAQLETVFANCFGESHRTRVRGGAEEPFYTPATDAGWAEIHYRHDYIRSLLHEVAHWCLAGENRRRLSDYGYWYQPDNRDATAQAGFYAVEARPQALEQLFCEALNLPFSASIDRPGGDVEPAEEALFSARIGLQRARYLTEGLPERGAIFHRQLRLQALG